MRVLITRDRAAVGSIVAARVVGIFVAAAVVAMTSGCGGWPWETCGMECSPYRAYCRDGVIVRCHQNEYTGCTHEYDDFDCGEYEGGACVEYLVEGIRRATCVDQRRPCDVFRQFGCLNESAYYLCAAGYIAIDEFGQSWGRCSGVVPACVEYVDSDGRGQVECVLSGALCPGGRAEYCLDNEVYTCGVSGYPVARSACALEEVCIELDATEAACTPR